MAAGWIVTGQRQTTVSNGLTYVPAMIIGFRTEGGNTGNVTLTGDQYTSEGVIAALQSAADLIDKVGNAKAGSVPSSTLLS